MSAQCKERSIGMRMTYAIIRTLLDAWRDSPPHGFVSDKTLQTKLSNSFPGITIEHLAMVVNYLELHGYLKCVPVIDLEMSDRFVITAIDRSALEQFLEKHGHESSH